MKSNEVYATSWTYSFNFNSRKITSGAPMLYLLISAPLSAEVMPLLSLPLPSSCPITKVFVVGRGRQSCCVLISSQRGKVRGSGKTSGSLKKKKKKLPYVKSPGGSMHPIRLNAEYTCILSKWLNFWSSALLCQIKHCGSTENKKHMNAMSSNWLVL